MDIEGLAQAAGGHHRAFDVPARPPGAPGRLPAGLARLGGFPQNEIQRVFLGLVDLDACADLQVLDPAPRKLAVADELADAVVDVAITRRIGVTLVDQGLDHREHAVDMLRSARLDVRAQYVEARLVLVHGGDHALHQRLERLAVFIGTPNDLVVDIGDVAHVSDLVAALTQPAGDHVEGHHHSCMADVAEVIDGHTAHIHAHLVAFQRLEGFLGLAQGVVDGKHL